jgi:hypothetical protein
MPNPSFEEATLPSWPDYYRPWYSEPLIGAPDQGWGQDPTNPFEGKFCLRITRNKGGYNSFYAYISPQSTHPQRYVFSLYLRGERDGLQVLFGGEAFPWQKATLTTTWRRYSVSGVVPPRADPYNMIQLRLQETGRIWVDAVQMEPGEEPTALEN